MRGMPVVVVPVPADEAALDACLHALDDATPAGTRVWLADDAQAGPRARGLIEHWRRRTALHAEYTRRARAIGEAAHLDAVLRACGDDHVAVLAADARPAPGWLEALQACLSEADVATATPWCNAGETAGFPRLGHVAPAHPLQAMARACAGLRAGSPGLPAAVTHAVLLRGGAVRAAGGLDVASYRTWYAALTDLSLRLAGLGQRNVLCARAYVARAAESLPDEIDAMRLAARWPDWNARLARFLMDDPLHALREALARRVLADEPAQPGLFDAPGNDACLAPSPRDAACA